MNLKIKGQVAVKHFRIVDGAERSFVQDDGETLVPSQLVIKDGKALVWNFDSLNVGSKEFTRETHKFLFSEVERSSYTAHNGDFNQSISFLGGYKWVGKDYRQERLRLSTFDNWESCFVDLEYIHNNKYRGKDMQRVSGNHDFETIDKDSQIALRNLYESLDK
jgi:hypothetical protein